MQTIENRPYTVGFAAETENVIEYARGKLTAKNLDMIIANNVADTSIGFNSDQNETTVITATAKEIIEVPQPKMSKEKPVQETHRAYQRTVGRRLMQSLQVKVLNPKIGSDIPMPSYSTPGSAGMDLRACLDGPQDLAPGDTSLILPVSLSS